MSTFLVSLGVVAATIAAVLHVVLNGPDQPATIRRQPSRGERRNEKAAAQAAQAKARSAAAAAAAANLAAAQSRRAAVAAPVAPALAGAESEVMRLRVLPARRTTLWARFRSAVVLMVLVAILGALLALVIGGVMLGIALLIRSATG